MPSATFPPVKQKVEYISVAPADTHSKVVGYLLWFFLGFVGAHRFYYGKPVSGVIWFLTFGLLGIGWLIDAFLIPDMDDEADSTYTAGSVDYSISWVLLWIFGLFGLHRIYQGKVITGIIFALTGGLFLIGYVYDILTMNEQIDELNSSRQSYVAHGHVAY